MKTPTPAEAPAVPSDADAAYHERNQVVAALAKLFPSGTARTEIPGWDPEWFGCVYIELPTGQVSWHYHDREAALFADLPPYKGAWDGHDTPEKYRRLNSLKAPDPSGVVTDEDIGNALGTFRSTNDTQWGCMRAALEGFRATCLLSLFARVPSATDRALTQAHHLRTALSLIADPETHDDGVKLINGVVDELSAGVVAGVTIPPAPSEDFAGLVRALVAAIVQGPEFRTAGAALLAHGARLEWEIKRLTKERDRAEDRANELEQAPWPTWATDCLKQIRKVSGYDGYDDADGVDLPEELADLISETETGIERLTKGEDSLRAAIQSQANDANSLRKELKAAQAEIHRLKAELAQRDATLAETEAQAKRAEYFLNIRERQMRRSTEYWVRAAKAALGGKPTELRNRVEMAEAAPVDVVASGDEDAALAQAAGDEWLPIESAPKDADILLSGRVGSSERMKVGWFDKDTSAWIVSIGRSGLKGHFVSPTHWRPLPAPPGVAQAAGDENLPEQANETRGGTGDDCSVGKRGAWPPLGGASSSRVRTSDIPDVTGGRDPNAKDVMFGGFSPDEILRLSKELDILTADAVDNIEVKGVIYPVVGWRFSDAQEGVRQLSALVHLAIAVRFHVAQAAKPTAGPVSVPEEVRALSELSLGATQGLWDTDFDELVKIRDDQNALLATVSHVHLQGRRSSREVYANAKLMVAAVNAVRALLAQQTPGDAP